MKAGTVGRALGVGARLLGQRVMPPTRPVPTAAEARTASDRRLRTGERLGRRTRDAGRGGREFGRAVWNPFARAGGVLWFEITGMFFLLFGVLFGQHLWTIRASWRGGPEHGRFLLYAVFSLLFLYFAASSFARARRRGRR